MDLDRSEWIRMVNFALILILIIFFFKNAFQGVLCQVNQSTKAVLNLLGVFTVSSFHAYICARSPSLLSNLLAGRGASRKRSLPTNQSLEQNTSGDRQNSLGMPSSKSFEDDEDDFNESSLIHTRIPGKKVRDDLKCISYWLGYTYIVNLSYLRRYKSHYN